MPKYVIERELPGAGQLSADELHAISSKSNSVLSQRDGRATWLQRFVTDDKIYCVYRAEDVAAVREHGNAGGFPVTSVSRVSAGIDPSTGE
jgi:hypothetical protein